jgi:hypothetical protein
MFRTTNGEDKSDVRALNGLSDHPMVEAAVRARKRIRARRDNAKLLGDRARAHLKQAEEVFTVELADEASSSEAEEALRDARRELAEAEADVAMHERATKEADRRLEQAREGARDEIRAALREEARTALPELWAALQVASEANEAVLRIVTAQQRLLGGRAVVLPDTAAWVGLMKSGTTMQPDTRLESWRTSMREHGFEV